MPCTDGGVPYPPTRQQRLTAMMPAALCGVLNALSLEELARMLTVFDEKEAGVTTEEMMEWWTHHKEEDAERRRRERRGAEQKAAAKAALAKLSRADRKALGLD